MSWSKRVGFATVFFLLSHHSFSQTTEIDSVLRTIDFRKDSVLAIFQWVTREIDYDPQQLLLVSKITTYGSLSQNTIREAIKRKKGVCQHYALLFDALLKRAGYESYVIEGYTRQDVYDDKYAHVWNAVKTNGQWFLYDPTWAAGYVRSFVYTRSFNQEWYKVRPVRFIETHIPFDPIWQFLNPPLKQPQNGTNAVLSTKEGNYSFQDSIHVHNHATERERASASFRRIKNMQNTNPLAQQYARSLELYVKNSNDYAMLLTAHQILRKAVAAYNNYIFSKNHQFKSPQWTDEMLEAFPPGLKIQTDSSETLLNTVATADVQIAQYQVQLKKQVTEFNVNIETEATFIRKYLATWKPLRMQHFYKK